MKKISVDTVGAELLENGWVDGTIDEYRFQAKVYNESSRFGIGEGRVSKLAVWDEKKRRTGTRSPLVFILSYDRGWNKEPSTETHKGMLKRLLEYLENLPTTAYWKNLSKEAAVVVQVRQKSGHPKNA